MKAANVRLWYQSLVHRRRNLIIKKSSPIENVKIAKYHPILFIKVCILFDMKSYNVNDYYFFYNNT